MAISRYQNAEIFENDDYDYWEVFKKRFGNNEQVQSISQRETLRLDYPVAEEVVQFSFANEYWGPGARLYKYAEKHYGDAKYWWVIAWFNKKPTDAHYKIGELVKIPLPLEQVLGYYGL
jgi:hypothetical protein